MKVIIAGPRDRGANFDLLDEVLVESQFKMTELVCGMAQGIDTCAFNWAKEYKKLPIKEFEITGEHWRIQGLAAGPLRNEEMAKYADALIAIWDGESKGTKSMIKLAKKYGLKVFVRYI